MALGGIAKKMLGFADEFMEGASKGIGDAGSIKASVNKISSNMSKAQKKKLVKFGASAKEATERVASAQAYFKNTKNAAVNVASKAGNAAEAKRIGKMKGFKYTDNLKQNLRSTSLDRVKGIQNPTLGNRLGDAMGGGFKDTYTGLKAGAGLGQSLNAAYMNGDKLRMDRVAGSFVAASAGARIATGGGLYKDRNGSTNIIGIPFI